MKTNWKCKLFDHKEKKVYHPQTKRFSRWYHYECSRCGKKLSMNYLDDR